MSHDLALVERVRVMLARTPRVERKNMFGATAFLVKGKLCVSARPEGIMCRIDPALHDAALQREGCRSVVMKGREYQGYVRVDAAALSTKRELGYWIGLALAYNATARAAAKKGRKARSPGRRLKPRPTRTG